jgi:DNA-directed RNA polymerase subunit RPC12/RpoP
MPEGSGYKCDKCGASVGEEDTKCPKCGDAFEEEKKPKCRFCGADVREGDYLCGRCGRPLRDDMAGPSLSGIGLMVLGGLIYLISFIYSATSPQPGSTVEELSKQLKDARTMSMIGAVGTVIFMVGCVVQCLSLFMAAKSQQPKQ